VSYAWATGDVPNGERINDVLSRGATLTLKGSTLRNGAPARWPKRKAGVMDMPELILTAAEGAKQLTARRTVDDTAYTSSRTFSSLNGQLGPLDRRSAWTAAAFEAIVQVMDAESSLVTLQSEDRFSRDRLRMAFDQLYGITQAERDAWSDEDYAVTPLPIRAELEVFLNSAPVWTATGMAARVWEHDEDVRGLHVVYFRNVLHS
jgi:hypothetical protein